LIFSCVAAVFILSGILLGVINFNPSTILFDLIEILSILAAPVMLALYVFKLHTHKKQNVFQALPALLLALYNLSFLIATIILFREYAFDALGFQGILIVAQIALYATAGVFQLKKAPKNLILLIAAAVSLLDFLIFALINTITYMFDYNLSPSYLFERLLLSFIPYSFLYVAVLLFALNKPATEPAEAAKNLDDTAAALQLLKDKLELGIITEDEYLAQRQSILDNL
jgi:uncharacterized membrane protein